MPNIAETRTRQNRYFFSTSLVDSVTPKSRGIKNRNFRRQDTSQEPFLLLRRQFEVKDRVHPGLAALTCKFLFDFVAVNRVHDNDIIRTIFTQK